MKSLTKNLLLLAVIAVFAYSCNQDDPEDVTPSLPEVNVDVTLNGTATTSPVAMQAGDSIGFSISGTAEGGFNTLNVTYSVDGGSSSELFTTNRNILELEAGTEVLPVLGIGTTLDASFVGSTVVFTFEIVDEESQVNITTVEAVVTSPDARSYSAVLLVVPLGDESGQNFFSSSTGMVYSSNEVTGTAEAVSPLIDFGYYYGESDLASIASPLGFESTVFSAQVSGWLDKNATVIKSTELDASAFTEVSTYADIDTEFDAGTDEEGIITGLAVGDVIAFETVDGVRGLALITEQNGTFNEGDNIEIDVLVQLPASE